MADRPDFDALRAQRNAEFEAAVQKICDEHGWERSAAFTSFDSDACYCACATGGPCEHQFGGWREFEDGCGGEQVCSRCGVGAMSHSLSTCDD